MEFREKKVRGINILNPVDVDREYYLNAIDYAIENEYNHIQVNGPIHNLQKSNLDGMMFYRKYKQFNVEKDAEYVKHCMAVVNEALEKSHKAGIKTYMWHHELELPNAFNDTFPEILNEYGDVEVSHPLIKDFLEHKIQDFFAAYPLMDGFVLTYYETKVPLLRLKKQKMTVNEIMTYVTKILYDTCKSLGKEVIVRTDAPLEEDYQILLGAYERVATSDMMIMDKWTQYDWSLSLPNNYFIRNIKKNPLLIETDIFGEFFGKGRLPLMLKEHIKEKFVYCEKYNPIGYCSRIDRGGASAFGTVNEVNLHIMKAVLNGFDLEETIEKFFINHYGTPGRVVKAVMEQTEDIVRKILFANGYYYSELSWFPTLNHSKNHFYFELMRENYKIASNEWFVPVNYERGDVENIFRDLDSAQEEAEQAYRKIEKLKDQIDEVKYSRLFIDFKNLELVAKCWVEMAKVFYHYVRYFDEKKEEQKTHHKVAFRNATENLRNLDADGKRVLGKDFYCNIADVGGVGGKQGYCENILNFVEEVTESFTYEEKVVKELAKEELTDFVVCGGACEGHELQKEVNFSDTLLVGGELVRIPGNKEGMKWSTIVAHGWFSYRLKLKPSQENVIRITAGSSVDTLKMKVTVGTQEYVIDRSAEVLDGKQVISLKYLASAEEEAAMIKIEKITANMPLVYMIKVI